MLTPNRILGNIQIISLEYIAFVTLGFFATLSSAIFGFGTALIVLSIGAHILPIKETIALATVLFSASTMTKSVVFRKHINWKMVLIMSLSSLPFALLGALLMTAVPADLLQRLLGLMILFYVIFKSLRRLPAVSVTTPWLITASLSYGFISGLLGSGNLVKVVLFQQMQLSKEAFVGAMAATSVLANWVKIGAYSASGLFSDTLILPSVSLCIVAIISVLIGKHFLQKLSTTQFDVGIRITLTISAVGLLAP